MKKKEIVETKGVKINIKKGKLVLPDKALSILKKSVKKNTKGKGANGTYFLDNGFTYTKYKDKEYCHRNAYISKDYLIVPLNIDNISKPEILSEEEVEVVDESVKTTDNLMEGVSVWNKEKLNKALKELREEISENKGEVFVLDTIDEKLSERVEDESTETLEAEYGIEDVNYKFNFKYGDMKPLSEIGFNSYFIYNDDLYIKFKLSNGCTCRRIPDMQLLSSLFKHNKVDNNLEVRELIM